MIICSNRFWITQSVHRHNNPSPLTILSAVLVGPYSLKAMHKGVGFESMFVMPFIDETHITSFQIFLMCFHSCLSLLLASDIIFTDYLVQGALCFRCYLPSPHLV